MGLAARGGELVFEGCRTIVITMIIPLYNAGRVLIRTFLMFGKGDRMGGAMAVGKLTTKWLAAPCLLLFLLLLYYYCLAGGAWLRGGSRGGHIVILDRRPRNKDDKWEAKGG